VDIQLDFVYAALQELKDHAYGRWDVVLLWASQMDVRGGRLHHEVKELLKTPG
jgi:hypothetical protein